MAFAFSTKSAANNWKATYTITYGHALSRQASLGKGNDVGLTPVHNTDPHEAVISTSFVPIEGAEEPPHVPACPNCQVVLQWLGIQDLHAGEAVRSSAETEESSTVTSGDEQ